MEKSNFAFGRMNFILLGVGMLAVIIGFILMGGGSSSEEAYNPDIFSTRRIVIGPMVALLGFISIIVAILWRTPSKSADKEEDTVPFYKRER